MCGTGWKRVTTDQRDDLKAHEDVLYAAVSTTKDKSMAEVFLGLTSPPDIIKEINPHPTVDYAPSWNIILEKDKSSYRAHFLPPFPREGKPAINTA